MKDLYTIEEIDAFTSENELAFLYISQPNCSICVGLLPQIKELMEDYPEIKLAHVNTTDVPEVAGKFSIFTIPVLLLFYEGKEHIREARIVHLELLDEKINKIYENVVG